MAKYSISNELGGGSSTQQAISTAYKTLLAVFASSTTTRRGKLYDIIVGTNGTPADTAYEFDVARMTVDGTGTSDTPTILDPADAAFGGTSKVNYTIEPTVTANSTLWYAGINQRASHRWVAAPGSELVYPATQANGFVLRGRSPSGTSTATGTVLIEEQ